MDTLEKADLTALIRHIQRFLKSEIPIYNSEVPGMAGKKREEEEQRQLQSVMRLKRSNKVNYSASLALKWESHVHVQNISWKSLHC